jgi:Phage Mu protein F like protein
MARATRLTRQQQRIIRELVAKHDPLIRQAFEAAIQGARGALDFDEIVRLAEIGDWNRIEQLMRLNQAILFPLEEAIRTAIIAGGTSVTLPKGIQGSFGFNGRHPRAEQIIAETSARLVTEIGSPGVEAVRAVILQGQHEGIGAQKTARRLAGTINPRTGVRQGGIMGLDGPRAQRSARVREILNDPDQIAKYFSGSKPRYSSTDRRYDARVRKAIAEGRALDKATIEKIAKAHDARLLKARGKAIAEHEAFTAQAQGRREAYEQLMESGKVESIDKKWNHNTAQDARPDHRALDGKTVGFNEAFVMDDMTALQYPHDPDAPAHHTLGCRCSVIYVPQFRRPGT